jgi:hypothetical protein
LEEFEDAKGVIRIHLNRRTDNIMAKREKGATQKTKNQAT